MLNNKQKIKLLEIARRAICTYISENRELSFEVDDEMLKKEYGVFVTIHKKGELKGCIGNILPQNKLYASVGELAIASAAKDSRFNPVTCDELDDIDIEISVLTPLKKVKSPDEIVIGRDGVIVKKGVHQGVYLPQVAKETGWSREEFLSNLCYSKAGLPPDAWKDEDVEIFIFQSEVFSEKEMNLK